KFPDLLLVLVPRHPERFAAVGDMIDKRQLEKVKRTDDRACDATTRVFLGDTMGEVPLFYAASDVAFVGGSLVPIGGHNMLEPAALGLPVISGPHIYNAQDIADMFIELGACHIVHDAPELAAAVDQLLSDPADARGRGIKAQEIVQRNRGALAHLLGLLEPLIGKELNGPG
ncbi:MAG: glycosyltransferase, partial [Gammaproteobacteria bacterium]|nr:glycosyltransferase [Gammaproteobacteria bacterium]